MAGRNSQDLAQNAGGCIRILEKGIDMAKTVTIKKQANLATGALAKGRRTAAKNK